MRKSVYNYVMAVFGLLFGFSLFTGMIELAAGGLVAASLIPPGTYADPNKAFTDPDRIKQWSLKYFYRTQSKTIFDESYTGVAIAKDGPKKSDTVVGPPVILVTDLKSQNGMVVTYTMINPLFNSSEERLRYSRVKGQIREGSEKTSSKKFVQFPLASAFWAVKEEDVFVGKKEIGMANLTAEMTRLLSDNTAQYMDDDAIESFFTGHSRHLYTTLAKARGAANETPVVASTELGIPTPPQEHPNTLAWIVDNGNTVLRPASAEAGANIDEKVHSLLSKVTSAAMPSARLLDYISLEVKRRKMVGTQYVDKKFNRTLFTVVVDPITMMKFRHDFQADGSGFGNIVTGAYQTTGDEHPLIKQGSIVWGDLLVVEEEKLLDDAFSNSHAFGASAVGAFVDAAQIKRTIDGDGVEHYWVERGERAFETGTPAYADSEIGEKGGDKIGNIMVMGANALGRVPGPIQPLIPRTTDDYTRIKALGSEHVFGHKRLDWVEGQTTDPYNQSSLRIAVYRGA